jgi:F-box and WD-40 domain protein CDC4
VTGGSDGSVRVWSLEKMAPIHRLAAHDNSVTSLQFDDSRVVSGGSDGRVKVWDLKTGQLVRELTAPADAVWRVAFEEEKCVVMASRSNRTIMEVCMSISQMTRAKANNLQVWSFSPPADAMLDRGIFGSLPPRPLSETGYHYSTADEPMTGLISHETSYSQDDMDMSDAGPSTAPPRVTGTFFHDD